MLVALAFTGAIGPFATATYLPALPLIVHEFGVTASTAQLSGISGVGAKKLAEYGDAVLEVLGSPGS